VNLVGTGGNSASLLSSSPGAVYLAKGKRKIVLLDKSDPVILLASPISGEVGISIDEASLKDLRQQVAAHTPGWEEENDDHGEN
jgi:hypothetical protein